MKKYFLWLLALIFILWPEKTFANNQVEAIGSPQALVLNERESGLVGFNIKDYNYYRLRDLAKILKDVGLDFSLWGDEREIIINLDASYKDGEYKDPSYRPYEKKRAIEKTMTLRIIKNGQEETRSLKAYNIADYNYFKLRDMGEILSYQVAFNEEKNQALVSYEKTSQSSGRVVLGNERLIEEHSSLIKNKNYGLITNQTGIDSKGIRTVDKLYNYTDGKLVAIYSPEHGLDGLHPAGEYVESYVDEKLNLPVYSLYGKTREPSQAMLKGIDLLIFDIQDIGSRTYTYVSTMNYAMKAAQKAGIKFVVLDRPNPVGDTVEGFMLEDKYKTFVGVDLMPMAHGMTAGELAKYYNRKIGVDLTVIEMKNYRRSMIWQDTGLPFSKTSPNIPTIEAAFNYMATGIGDNTGFGQADKFSWVGAKNLDATSFAQKMNSYNLPGVLFIGEKKGERGGVRLKITNYHTYNPQLTGTYLLATANLFGAINIPEESNGVIPMFEKIHGTNKMGLALKAKKTPQEIVESYQKDLEAFKEIRKGYLIYK